MNNVVSVSNTDGFVPVYYIGALGSEILYIHKTCSEFIDPKDGYTKVQFKHTLYITDNQDNGKEFTVYANPLKYNISYEYDTTTTTLWYRESVGANKEQFVLPEDVNPETKTETLTLYSNNFIFDGSSLYQMINIQYTVNKSGTVCTVTLKDIPYGMNLNVFAEAVDNLQKSFNGWLVKEYDATKPQVTGSITATSQTLYPKYVASTNSLYKNVVLTPDMSTNKVSSIVYEFAIASRLIDEDFENNDELYINPWRQALENYAFYEKKGDYYIITWQPFGDGGYPESTTALYAGDSADNLINLLSAEYTTKFNTSFATTQTTLTKNLGVLLNYFWYTGIWESADVSSSQLLENNVIAVDKAGKLTIRTYLQQAIVIQYSSVVTDYRTGVDIPNVTRATVESKIETDQSAVLLDNAKYIKVAYDNINSNIKFVATVDAATSTHNGYRIDSWRYVDIDNSNIFEDYQNVTTEHIVDLGDGVISYLAGGLPKLNLVASVKPITHIVTFVNLTANQLIRNVELAYDEDISNKPGFAYYYPILDTLYDIQTDDPKHNIPRFMWDFVHPDDGGVKADSHYTDYQYLFETWKTSNNTWVNKDDVLKTSIMLFADFAKSAKIIIDATSMDILIDELVYYIPQKEFVSVEGMHYITSFYQDYEGYVIPTIAKFKERAGDRYVLAYDRDGNVIANLYAYSSESKDLLYVAQMKTFADLEKNNRLEYNKNPNTKVGGYILYPESSQTIAVYTDRAYTKKTEYTVKTVGGYFRATVYYIPDEQKSSQLSLPGAWINADEKYGVSFWVFEGDDGNTYYMEPNNLAVTNEVYSEYAFNTSGVFKPYYNLKLLVEGESSGTLTIESNNGAPMSNVTTGTYFPLTYDCATYISAEDKLYGSEFTRKSAKVSANSVGSAHYLSITLDSKEIYSVKFNYTGVGSVSWKLTSETSKSFSPIVITSGGVVDLEDSFGIIHIVPIIVKGQVEISVLQGIYDSGNNNQIANFDMILQVNGSTVSQISKVDMGSPIIIDNPKTPAAKLTGNEKITIKASQYVSYTIEATRATSSNIDGNISNIRWQYLLDNRWQDLLDGEYVVLPNGSLETLQFRLACDTEKRTLIFRTIGSMSVSEFKDKYGNINTKVYGTNFDFSNALGNSQNKYISATKASDVVYDKTGAVLYPSVSKNTNDSLLAFRVPMTAAITYDVGANGVVNSITIFEDDTLSKEIVTISASTSYYSLGWYGLYANPALGKIDFNENGKFNESGDFLGNTFVMWAEERKTSSFIVEKTTNDPDVVPGYGQLKVTVSDMLGTTTYTSTTIRRSDDKYEYIFTMDGDSATYSSISYGVSANVTIEASSIEDTLGHKFKWYHIDGEQSPIENSTIVITESKQKNKTISVLFNAKDTQSLLAIRNKDKDANKSVLKTYPIYGGYQVRYADLSTYMNVYIEDYFGDTKQTITIYKDYISNANPTQNTFLPREGYMVSQFGLTTSTDSPSAVDISNTPNIRNGETTVTPKNNVVIVLKEVVESVTLYLKLNIVGGEDSRNNISEYTEIIKYLQTTISDSKSITLSGGYAVIKLDAISQDGDLRLGLQSNYLDTSFMLSFKDANYSIKTKSYILQSACINSYYENNEKISVVYNAEEDNDNGYGKEQEFTVEESKYWLVIDITPRTSINVSFMINLPYESDWKNIKLETRGQGSSILNNDPKTFINGGLDISTVSGHVFNEFSISLTLEGLGDGDYYCAVPDIAGNQINIKLCNDIQSNKEAELVASIKFTPNESTYAPYKGNYFYMRNSQFLIPSNLEFSGAISSYQVWGIITEGEGRDIVLSEETYLSGDHTIIIGLERKPVTIDIDKSGYWWDSNASKVVPNESLTYGEKFDAGSLTYADLDGINPTNTITVPGGLVVALPSDYNDQKRYTGELHETVGNTGSSIAMNTNITRSGFKISVEDSAPTTRFTYYTNETKQQFINGYISDVEPDEYSSTRFNNNGADKNVQSVMTIFGQGTTGFDIYLTSSQSWRIVSTPSGNSKVNDSSYLNVVFVNKGPCVTFANNSGEKDKIGVLDKEISKGSYLIEGLSNGGYAFDYSIDLYQSIIRKSSSGYDVGGGFTMQIAKNISTRLYSGMHDYDINDKNFTLDVDKYSYENITFVPDKNNLVLTGYYIRAYKDGGDCEKILYDQDDFTGTDANVAISNYKVSLGTTDLQKYCKIEIFPIWEAKDIFTVTVADQHGQLSFASKFNYLDTKNDTTKASIYYVLEGNSITITQSVKTSVKLNPSVTSAGGMTTPQNYNVLKYEDNIFLGLYASAMFEKDKTDSYNSSDSMFNSYGLYRVKKYSDTEYKLEQNFGNLPKGTTDYSCTFEPTANITLNAVWDKLGYNVVYTKPSGDACKQIGTKKLKKETTDKSFTSKTIQYTSALNSMPFSVGFGYNFAEDAKDHKHFPSDHFSVYAYYNGAMALSEKQLVFYNELSKENDTYNNVVGQVKITLAHIDNQTHSTLITQKSVSGFNVDHSTEHGFGYLENVQFHGDWIKNIYNCKYCEFVDDNGEILLDQGMIKTNYRWIYGDQLTNPNESGYEDACYMNNNYHVEYDYCEDCEGRVSEYRNAQQCTMDEGTISTIKHATCLENGVFSIRCRYCKHTVKTNGSMIYENAIKLNDKVVIVEQQSFTVPAYATKPGCLAISGISKNKGGHYWMTVDGSRVAPTCGADACYNFECYECGATQTRVTVALMLDGLVNVNTGPTSQYALENLTYNGITINSEEDKATGHVVYFNSDQLWLMKTKEKNSSKGSGTIKDDSNIIVGSGKSLSYYCENGDASWKVNGNPCSETYTRSQTCQKCKKAIIRVQGNAIGHKVDVENPQITTYTERVHNIDPTICYADKTVVVRFVCTRCDSYMTNKDMGNEEVGFTRPNNIFMIRLKTYNVVQSKKTIYKYSPTPSVEVPDYYKAGDYYSYSLSDSDSFLTTYQSHRDETKWMGIESKNNEVCDHDDCNLDPVYKETLTGLSGDFTKEYYQYWNSYNRIGGEFAATIAFYPVMLRPSNPSEIVGINNTTLTYKEIIENLSDYAYMLTAENWVSQNDNDGNPFYRRYESILMSKVHVTNRNSIKDNSIDTRTFANCNNVALKYLFNTDKITEYNFEKLMTKIESYFISTEKMLKDTTKYTKGDGGTIYVNDYSLPHAIATLMFFPNVVKPDPNSPTGWKCLDLKESVAYGEIHGFFPEATKYDDLHLYWHITTYK